jgi:hypothetical protein
MAVEPCFTIKKGCFPHQELQQQTLLAFHALPFTVKLRILMAEKAR